MKKVVSILAVAVFTIGMVSCTDDSASNDELYDTLEVTASDDEKHEEANTGSGGN